MPIQDELKYLLEKHLNNQLSEQERDRFKKLLQDEKNRQLISDDIEEILYQDRYHDLSDLDKQQLFEQVIHEAAIRQGEYKQPYLQSTTFRSLKISIGYAAAVIILLVSGVLFLFNRHSSNIKMSKVAVHEPPLVTSGNNQVMITLSDGSQVALNDINAATLAGKKGDNIVAAGNDKIIYKALPFSTGHVTYNTITTPHGGQYHITLPDNTQVWLNATSSLTFPVSFLGNDRTVVLTGEGYFEVAKDKAHPFIVKVIDIKVSVLGTHFNIMAYPDEKVVKTTLIEGSVKLASSHADMILKPGQQGNLLEGDDKFGLSEANIEQVLAWKNGEFRFEDTKLETIMRQVVRWYDLTVSYEGNVSDIFLSGIISRKEKVSELLAILEATHRVKFKMDGRRIIVMPY